MVVALCMWGLFWLGCAGSAADRSAEPRVETPEKERVEQVETFDPADLGEYQHRDESALSTEDVLDVEEFLKPGEGAEAATFGAKTTGYRVQLTATRNEQEARTVYNEAVMKLGGEVYMPFDDPYYKVRVGDYISRYRAETAQQQAIEKGFVDAWVVRTLVNVTQETTKESTSP
jgi:cell division septation protein DedD